MGLSSVVLCGGRDGKSWGMFVSLGVGEWTGKSRSLLCSLHQTKWLQLFLGASVASEVMDLTCSTPPLTVVSAVC